MPKTAKNKAPVEDTPVVDTDPIEGTDAAAGVESNDVTTPEPEVSEDENFGQYEIEETENLSNNTARAKNMKTVLAKQKKVLFMIPLGFGEVESTDEASYEYATINDYHMRVKKNRMALMPVQVAQMFAAKYNIEMNLSSGLKSKAATAKELN